MKVLIKPIQLAILYTTMAIVNLVLLLFGANPNLIKKKLFIGSMILALIVINSKKTQAQMNGDKTSVKTLDTIKIIQYKVPLIVNERTVSVTCYITAKEIEPVQKKEALNIIKENKLIYLGGTYNCEKFVKKNLKYPKIAKKEKIEGIVNVSFLINPDGTITNTYIQNSIGYGCDEEALRIVKLLSIVEPYKIDGKAVCARYVIKIKFKL